MSSLRKIAALDVTHRGLTYLAASPDNLATAGVPDAIVLAAYKAAACAMIDVDAEALRARVMTGGAGQAMEYQEAASQAFAALDAPDGADAERYPMLAASVGIDRDPQTGAVATDVLGVARSVKLSFLQWQAVGSAIRGARLGAKAEVMAASSLDAVDAVAPRWPQLA